MISSTDLAKAFAVLKASGFQEPAAWSGMDPEIITSTWAGMLADVPPHALEAAVVGYVRSGAEFWPRPGQLLHCARAAAKGPGLDVRAEFRWLVDTAHSTGSRARFDAMLARRHLGGVPAQLDQALRTFGGFDGLISTFHTRDSQGLKDFHFRLRDFQSAYDGAEQAIEDAKVLRLVARSSGRKVLT